MSDERTAIEENINEKLKKFLIFLILYTTFFLKIFIESFFIFYLPK